MKTYRKFILFTIVLVIIASVCKFFFGPNLDWSGFSPVIAIAVFSGFIFRQKGFSFMLALLALFISDAVIQFLYSQDLFPYPGFYTGQWKNYLLLLSCTLAGWALKGKNYSSMFLGALIAPVVFFLLSNFGVWAGPQLTYPKDINGLMASYAAGVPFFRNSLIATLVFLPGIMVLFNYMVKHKTQLTLA